MSFLPSPFNVHKQDRVADIEVVGDFLHFEARKDRLFLWRVPTGEQWEEEKGEQRQHAANHDRISSMGRVFEAHNGGSVGLEDSTVPYP
jgi:hypothetical protein